MLAFKQPAAEDLDWLKKDGFDAHLMQNDASYVNIYLLTEKYNTYVSDYEGTLLRFFPEGYLHGGYAAPVGDADYREIIPILEKDAEARKIPFRMDLLTEKDCERLEEAFPGKYSMELMTDFTEYIHKREQLANMAGSKFSKKRNHIAQFFKLHPDAHVEPITHENLKDAYAVARKWLDSKEEARRNYLEYEYRAILRSGENWDNWGLKGIVVYSDGQPVGMCIASEMSKGVYDVHFEKALAEYPHVWSVLVKELAVYLEDAEWINREEDLGDEGMRHSKMSYRPDLLIRKYRAVPKALA